MSDSPSADPISPFDPAGEARTLETLLSVGRTIAAELDLDRAVQIVTDAATELVGAAFGSFFYNVIDAAGESYTLYALSGAPREAFSGFPMPRNTAVFGPTFAGEGVVRSADITRDLRYGKSPPYYGRPKGHLPVRSYLAAPVVSRTGEVLGGLFFGHEAVGVFTERSERIALGIASHAAVAIDNARLYEAAQRELARRSATEAALRVSEDELRRANTLLQARVQERGREAAAAERDFRLLVEGVTDYAIYRLDPAGVVTSWNAGAQKIKGFTADDIIGQNFAIFYTPEDRDRGEPAGNLARAAAAGRFETEGWRVRKDGTRFLANVVIDPLLDEGKLVGFAKVTRDITELRAMETQLRQAQKMETIGQLTGGVAHDFNNLLMVIIGNLESLQRRVEQPGLEPDRLRGPLAQAYRGAERAIGLTQKLLAFARRQPLAPQPVDVGRTIATMSELLRSTLGEGIEVAVALAQGLWSAHVDPNQLENALINLAVNARDAMPEGGKLTIETENTYLDAAYVGTQPDVAEGPYVMVCISDTGTGMTREVIAQAFEPFFTTKDVGHGTGLGLSQVYGFIKQSGGHVRIYSEPGAGTTVKLYLPRVLDDPADSDAEEAAMDLARGHRSEVVLVVEDDDDVRAHSTAILTELGYTTLEAERGDVALALIATRPDVRLMFTDVGLPGGMNGRQLADRARERRPDLKVLFTTGYAQNAIVHEGRLDPGVALITKPFTFAALAAKLREVLDDGGSGAGQVAS